MHTAFVALSISCWYYKTAKLRELTALTCQLDETSRNFESQGLRATGYLTQGLRSLAFS